MAEKAPDPSEQIDPHKIHYLVRLMKRYDLTDLNISDGQVQIRLKRRGPEPAHSPLHFQPAAAIAGMGALPHPPPHQSGPVPAHRPEAEPAAESKTIVIRSPMVGTYYASSAPESPQFVSVGSAVTPDTTICIIEAMKVFTDIPAGVSGTITEILVKNGQAVEFDQPLLRVKPA
jgi:acetyl-CoA carboxylase biotin carboxyl carrier protein